MKTLKKLSLLIMAALLCLSLAACGPFEGYDDDDAIIAARSYYTIGSVISNTSDAYSLKAKTFNGVITIKNVTVTANYVKTIFSTKYESNFLNWVLFVVCFGWIWMWFI